jgi:RNA polymerase sigma factor (sigma-70 family)
MASTTLSPVLRYIRKIVDRSGFALVPDSQLLDRFIHHQNEAAFAELVERHGPMVMGACRRVLCNSHDAEDAFQATFLVLIRRACDIGDADRLANWLYGVAFRTATKAKTDAFRRQARESQAVHNRANSLEDEGLWHDVSPILDEEINLLPPKYRAPVVLCYLQGKTNEEAARQLGWPKGTVATRLFRARERLRHRLTRRGMAISTTVMATILSQARALGTLPASVVNGTIQTALLVVASHGLATGIVSNQIAALTKGVLKTMLISKLKTIATLGLVVGIAGVGVGAVTYGWKIAGPTEFRPVVATQVAHSWMAHSLPLDNEPAKHDEEPARAGSRGFEFRGVTDINVFKEQPPTIIPPAINLPPVPNDPSKETVHTPNFQVEAPTLEIAFKVCQAAEQYRKELSLLWLGKQLPRWKDRCRIQVNISPEGPSGATSFSFAEAKVSGQIMNLGGPLEIILASTLPHEMTHVILAHSFGRQLPRWADEGAAIMAETEKDRNRHESYLRQNRSRVIPLQKLMPMSDYPPEASILFAEGFSLTRFLVESGDRKKFLSFVEQGMSEGWDKAVKTHYSYQNVEEFEKAWLAHQQFQVREVGADWGGSVSIVEELPSFEFFAQDNRVIIQGIVGEERIYAAADRINYDQSKQVLILRGKGANSVKLQRQRGRTAEDIHASEIRYWLKDSKLEVDNSIDLRR